jgi:hypothetical protein
MMPPVMTSHPHRLRPLGVPENRMAMASSMTLDVAAWPEGCHLHPELNRHRRSLPHLTLLLNSNPRGRHS